MKKILYTILFLTGFLFVTNSAHAGIPIFYGNGKQIAKIKELPDSITLDGKHVNLGVSFDQFSLFWIPVWNYGEVEYVAIPDNENSYYELDFEEIEYLGEISGYDTQKAASIPFWHKFGGKFVWILVIGAIIWFGRKGNDDETPTENPFAEDEAEQEEEELEEDEEELEEDDEEDAEK